MNNTNTSKIRKRYYFTKEFIDDIESNPLVSNVGDFIETLYYNYSRDISTIAKQIKEKYEEAQKLEEFLKKIKKEHNQISINEEEKKYIISDCIPSIKNSFDIELIYKKFVYKFNSVLTRKQFVLTLSELGWRGK